MKSKRKSNPPSKKEAKLLKFRLTQMTIEFQIIKMNFDTETKRYNSGDSIWYDRLDNLTTSKQYLVATLEKLLNNYDHSSKIKENGYLGPHTLTSIIKTINAIVDQDYDISSIVSYLSNLSWSEWKEQKLGPENIEIFKNVLTLFFKHINKRESQIMEDIKSESLKSIKNLDDEKIRHLGESIEHFRQDVELAITFMSLSHLYD